MDGRIDKLNLGPLHTRGWEPVTITLQALSLVETAEPVQVHFTLRLRDKKSMWMQDGCEVYMDSYVASNGYESVRFDNGNSSNVARWRNP